MTEEDPIVLQDLRRYLERTDNPSPDVDTGSSLFDQTAMAVPVAAMKALLGVVQRSKAETMMGLQDELVQASAILQSRYPSDKNNKQRSHIALQSGCELFLKYVTRAFLEWPNFEECRKAVLERGERFQMISLAARDRIAVSAAEFIREGSTVLTHGWSRVVAAMLKEAAKTKHFDLIILEGRPDASGARAASFYAKETNIPVTVVLDAAMGYVMEKVDMVLVGAEGVVENGGVVNKLGTNALAICTKAAGKPFYVAAESYKFARLYPLHQSDLPPHRSSTPLSIVDTTRNGKGGSFRKMDLPDQIRIENPLVDFTPAKYITLLFTDLGVLTPSAVSDELIKLYQ